MWISRRKYKEFESRIYKLEFEREAVIRHLMEMDKQVRQNTADIQNNVHYITPPSNGKKVLNG